CVATRLRWYIPALMLVEYWNGPYRRVRRAPQPYFESLRDEPGDFAIIDLPMGRKRSQEWMFLQTIHRRPIVEGMRGPTLKPAYPSIEPTPLLSAGRAGSETDCEMLGRPEMQRAIEQLVDDGFLAQTVRRALLRYGDRRWRAFARRDAVDMGRVIAKLWD